jgi:membrane protease YdiL (CAAX protease family)
MKPNSRANENIDDKSKEINISRNKSYYVTSRPHVVKELVLFFIITFAIMFGLGGLGMVFRSQVEKVFGPISNNNLFVMLLIYAPTIAGLTLTIIFEKWSGLVALFKRGALFTKPKWLIVAIFIIPLILLVYGLFTYLTGIGASEFNWIAYFGTFPLLIFSLNIFTDAGPIGEELGWRGYALPRLLQLRSPIAATSILSVFWTVFHLVAFLSPGTRQSAISFFWFILFVFSLCFIMTWLYMNTGGNWIVSGLLQHYLINSFTINGAVKVGPGLCISLCLAVLIIFLFKGFSNKRSMHRGGASFKSSLADAPDIKL